MSQRKMKMKQLESLVEVEGLEEDSELVMRFPRPYGVFGASENLISVQNASFAWAEGAEPLFENVDFTISSKARIAILGKNGCGECINVLSKFPLVCACVLLTVSLLVVLTLGLMDVCTGTVGKTSLLNILVGDADPTVGSVGRHLGCRIARLQQHHYKGEQLDPNLTPLVSNCVQLTIVDLC